MKLPWHRRNRNTGVRTRVINAPSETVARLYAPGEPEIKPRYHVSPVTDSWSFRLVDRHGQYYPIFPGFYAALLRFVYTVEGTAEPMKDRTFAPHPFRLHDQGDSVYDWEWPIPWPYFPVKRPARWHPWFRDPPEDTGETRTVEVEHKDGTKTVSSEKVFKKGRLHFGVLHKGQVEIPALGKDTGEEIIDYVNGWEEKGHSAVLAEIAVNRAIRAEAIAKLEGTRQTLMALAEKYTIEAQRGNITKQMLDDLARLRRSSGHEPGLEDKEDG
jgi:hypothetical protein